MIYYIIASYLFNFGVLTSSFTEAEIKEKKKAAFIYFAFSPVSFIVYIGFVFNEKIKYK